MTILVKWVQIHHHGCLNEWRSEDGVILLGEGGRLVPKNMVIDCLGRNVDGDRLDGHLPRPLTGLRLLLQHGIDLLAQR